VVLSVRSLGRTGRQLHLAQYGAAVLVDGQMDRIVTVEADQLHHAVEHLHQARRTPQTQAIYLHNTTERFVSQKYNCHA